MSSCAGAPWLRAPWIADWLNSDPPFAAMVQIGIALAYDEGLSNREYSIMAYMSAAAQRLEKRHHVSY
jgi:hypothetical protein